MSIKDVTANDAAFIALYKEGRAIEAELRAMDTLLKTLEHLNVYYLDLNAFLDPDYRRMANDVVAARKSRDAQMKYMDKRKERLAQVRKLIEVYDRGEDVIAHKLAGNWDDDTECDVPF